MERSGFAYGLAIPTVGRAWFLALAIGLGLMLSACGGSNSEQSDGDSAGTAPSYPVTQTSEGDQVTIKVTRLSTDGAPAFRVAMDTHSVDLDTYDLVQLAVLRIDDGREARPSSWDAPKGGHHREGTLTFAASTTDGTPLIGPGTRMFELVIRDVAGVSERTFRWAP